MAVLAISLAACGGSSSGKLTPTAKKVNGPLGKFFEVVERDYKVSKDGAVFCLSVEFKRIAEGGPTKASWSSEPTFTVEFLDEDGNSIGSESTNVVRHEEQLESVFSLGIDETASVTFKFDENEVPKATKFKVTSKWDESAERERNSDTASETPENTESEISYGNHLAVLSKENILLPSSLKGSVEIVPEDNGNVYVDFDDDFPMVSLTFKLLKKVSTANLVSSYGQLWIVGHAQDAKGRNINDLNPKSISSREWRTGDSDGSEFKNFLEGEVGETITLDFHGESNIELFEKDQAKIAQGRATTTEAAKNFAKFKLSISN